MALDEFDGLFGDELERLTAIERSVLEMRFGLLDGLPLTLEQIGSRLGRTRARVHQIEQRATGKLRYRERGQPLYPYVHGRNAKTRRWNARGTRYLLDELERGGRRSPPRFDEPPAAGEWVRLRKLPNTSRRVVEWIAQGFSYSAILAADRRLRLEDIYHAVAELIAIADGLPLPAAVRRSDLPGATEGGVRRRRSQLVESARPATSSSPRSRPQDAQAPDDQPSERGAEIRPATRAEPLWRTEEPPRAAGPVRPWTNDDDEELRRLYAEGRHLAEIASMIGRHFGQMQSRIVRLNLTR